MFVLTLAVGVLVGVTMGALGGGGAIITVPTLVYLLGQDAREATTGSLVVVGTTALIGAWQHWRGGRVRVGPGVLFGALGVAGAFVGSRLAVGVPDPALLVGFAVLLLVVAVVMTVRRRRDATGAPVDERPVLTRSPWVVRWPRLGMLALTASAVGLLTGFFGVGGGFVIVPALVIVLGLPMRAAIGTSLLVIVVTSGSALASRLGEHVGLDWPVVAGFTAAALVGSVLGSRVSARVPPERLNLAFTVLLVVVAAFMAGQSIPAL